MNQIRNNDFLIKVVRQGRLMNTNNKHFLSQDVRNEHKVDVNMRIGVHSGYILSGIIGK